MSRYDFGTVAFKTSHNSYDRDESIVEQLTWQPETPYNCGCRGVEFDIWRHSSPYQKGQEIPAGFFTVSHIDPEGGEALKHYLDAVLHWHDNHAGAHGPVLVTIDIKSSHGSVDTFPDEIDTYLDVYFRRELIFSPGDLLQGGDSRELAPHVIENGWPEMKNKFVFCLSGTDEWKSYYASLDPTRRLCFADKDVPDDDPALAPPETGNIDFFNFHIWHHDRDIWTRTIPPFAQKNLMVRTYEANSEDNWRDCLNCGVSAIATDKVSNYPWAKVSDTEPYAKRGGR